jgi:hypothetical protein
MAADIETLKRKWATRKIAKISAHVGRMPKEEQNNCGRNGWIFFLENIDKFGKETSDLCSTSGFKPMPHRRRISKNATLLNKLFQFELRTSRPFREGMLAKEMPTKSIP